MAKRSKGQAPAKENVISKARSALAALGNLEPTAEHLQVALCAMVHSMRHVPEPGRVEMACEIQEDSGADAETAYATAAVLTGLVSSQRNWERVVTFLRGAGVRPLMSTTFLSLAAGVDVASGVVS